MKPGIRRKQETGRFGENAASIALARRGLEIIQRNWRCARGEIDLVARDGDCWVFVEVKTRRGRHSEPPEQALSQSKARRLVELAGIYMTEHGLFDVDWRIDLVAVELGAGCDVRSLCVIPGVGLE